MQEAPSIPCEYAENVERAARTPIRDICHVHPNECTKQYLPSKLDITHISEDHQQELCSILPEGYFVERLWQTEPVEHQIYLRDNKPVRQPLYHVPERLLHVLREELDMMLQLRVIEPSFCEWRSPIILVPLSPGQV